MTTTFTTRLIALGLAVAAHATALPAGATAPDWIPVLPTGTFTGQDGRGPYVLTDPAGLIAMRDLSARPIPVDYNHQTVFACQNGGEAPAGGWIDRMELREGLIWAHVDWTADGGAAVAAKNYRYVSPAFTHDEAGNVTGIESVALVNNPNLVDLPAIHSKLGEHMDEFLAQLRQALGLPAEADRAAVVTACKTANATVTAHSSTVSQIATLAGLKADAPATEIFAAVKAKIETGTPDPAKFVPMAAFAELQSQVATLTTASATKTAADAVATASAHGKVSPAMAEWALGYATKDPAGFEAWAKSAPAIVKPGGPGSKQPSTDANAPLTEEELAICTQLGVSPEAFAKQKVTV